MRCCSATTRCTGSCSRATSPEPDDRFQSAEEMADQLFGVLRRGRRRPRGHAGRGAQQALHDGLGRRSRAARLARAAPPAGLARRPGRRLPRDDHRGGPRADDRAAARGAAAHRRGGPAARRGDARRRLAGRRRCAAGRARGSDPREWRVRWYRGIADAGARARRRCRGQLRRRLHAPCRGSSRRSSRLGLPASSASAGSDWQRPHGGTRSSRGPIPRSRAHRSGWLDAACRPAIAPGLLRRTSVCPTPPAATSTRRSARIRCLSRGR